MLATTRSPNQNHYGVGLGHPYRLITEKLSNPKGQSIVILLFYLPPFFSLVKKPVSHCNNEKIEE